MMHLRRLWRRCCRAAATGIGAATRSALNFREATTQLRLELLETRAHYKPRSST